MARQPTRTNRGQSSQPFDAPPFPTVGIGASAGGVTALQNFFEALPQSVHAAFVVIVHLDPTHQSELPDILAKRTTMPVHQVVRKMSLEPGCVYVIPPNRRLLITDYEIATFAFDEPRGRRAPIDQFYRSLADQHGDGFAVVLTGAGSDGALGAKAIKEAGGLILVQDPTEAEYPSMPRSAIATGVADIVMPVKDLARELANLIKNKAHIAHHELAETDEESFKRILTHLRTRTGHDFSKYKRSTLYRRLSRRMQVRRVERLDEYYALLRSNAEEVQSLFGDLLISVTTFFRDSAAFQALADIAIPKLFHDDVNPIRVWVPGCATGEEAYSIAMLLSEEASRQEVRPEIQIFASDLDGAALSAAREGRYPLAIEADVGEERLRKFFTKEADHYRIKREVRDTVLFATHSLLKDPPFSRLDLVSCRNLLIYLERELQQQVIGTIHYALKPGGFLFLGSSETAETPPGLFRYLHRDARLFQSSAYGGDTPRELPRLNIAPRVSDSSFQKTSPTSSVQTFANLHSRALEQFAPPSVLVDSAHRILHISETAGRFIQPSSGTLPTDLSELVRPELRFDLRAALHAAIERKEPTLSLPIPVQFNGHPNRVYLLVTPVDQDEMRHALVVFIEGEMLDQASEKGDPADVQVDSVEVRRLKEELELTRSRLRASREESESANEELRAANEELQSINEEYRSTAEELETSKEELQSINEELQTVNAELKLKLESVSRTNSDLRNLMAATDVGTLFLDHSLRIKRFTPPVADLFNITTTDEGRSITDFTHRLDYPEFSNDARDVLRDLKMVERQVSGNGKWFLTRLRPYRTIDDRIDGVVGSFVDVTERVKAETALKANETQLRLLLSELSHRVKNTLAVVQSMARLTFREGRPQAEAYETFSSRLSALAAAHDLLVQRNWSGAELHKLAEHQLSAYADNNRITIDGPEVLLPPGIATPMSLILHELATNAVKYGSLSDDSGTLRLHWKLLPNNSETQLVLTWDENGGPPVKPPIKEGFGTYLIKSGMPGAKVKLNYAKRGLNCELSVSWDGDTA